MKRRLYCNIKQLTASYASGTASPRLIVDQALNDAVKLKYLNAFVRVTPQFALPQANESEFRYAQRTARGPLDGVTIAVKDNFSTKDVTTTCASRMLENYIPPYDATVCSRLKNAGAVLIGKTNLDQFAMGSGTVNSIYGPTRNVWSKDFDGDNWNIAGGSSGGSAVAVAAGICYAAIGSDTGGSTRNPAAYCGVIGLKPTYGLVSRYGLIPLVNSMDTPGIITRSVEDCAHVLNAISGHDFMDSTTIIKQFAKIELPAIDKITLKNIRIGIPGEYHCPGLSIEVLQTWTKIADMLENGGAQVRQVSLPHTAASIVTYSILNQCEVASNMARYDSLEYGHRASDDSSSSSSSSSSTEQLYAKSRAEGFSDVVKTRILTGNYFLLRKNYNKYFEKALRVRRLIAQDFADIMDSDNSTVDMLLTPTTLSVAPIYKDFMALSNQDQCAVQDFCTQPANMAGIPAISIPIGLSTDGLPIGLQLLGPKLSEARLLTVARWIEEHVEFEGLNSYQTFETIS